MPQELTCGRDWPEWIIVAVDNYAASQNFRLKSLFLEIVGFDNFIEFTIHFFIALQNDVGFIFS